VKSFLESSEKQGNLDSLIFNTCCAATSGFTWILLTCFFKLRGCHIHTVL
jgi:hypothetical protein